MPAWLSNLWNIPGRAWDAALKAANVTLWWRFGAALVVTSLIAWLIWIIWQGPWTIDVQPARLDWLGWIAVGLVILLALCIAALMDYRFTFRASKGGIEASAAGDEHDTLALSTRETEMTAGAPATPPTAVASPTADPGDLPVDQQVCR